MANDPLEKLRERAQEALSHGQYQEARQIYQEALGYRSDHPDLHYGIAAVCFVLGDLHTAIYHFKEVIRLEPLRASSYINLGAVYNRLGQYEDALNTLRRGIQLDTTRAEGYYNLALVYKQLGQLEQSINTYREAIRVNPRMVDAHFNLGNIFFEKSQHIYAIAHYRQALEIRPNWEKAKKALEIALAEQSKNDSEPPPAPVKSIPLKEPKLDPNRMLDPNVHGKWMQELHHLSIDTDNHSQNLLDFLQEEVVLSIRDLSICILTPDDPQNDLHEKMEKFDVVLLRLQQLHESLQKRINRVRVISEVIAKM